MSDTSRVLCFAQGSSALETVFESLRRNDDRFDPVRTDSIKETFDRLEDGGIEAVVAVEPPTPLVRAIEEDYPETRIVAVSADVSEGTAAVWEAVDVTGDEWDRTVGASIADAIADGSSSEGVPATERAPETGEAGRLVGEVRRELADATSPLDIERGVCRRLTAEGPHVFAWIGEYDRGEGRIVPWVTGTAVDNWPANETVTVGAGAETVVERAMRTGTLQVVDLDATPSSTVPWYDRARDHGCTAVAVVPLTDDELYGVMGVYTAVDGGFDDDDRTALSEIGDVVTHVLRTIALRGRADQQERALRRYERLVETAGDGMYVLDAGGHFTTVNDSLAAMTGYSREGMLGEHISLIMDEGAVREGRDLIEDLYRGVVDGPASMEMTLRTKDGEDFPCETTVALLPYEDEFRGSVGVVRDITERKERENALRRKNERLETFAEIVSHDLRNPLGVAQGYLDLVQTTGDLDRVDQVVDALDRMDDIIEDVLALARQGDEVTNPHPLGLEPLAREAWSNVETGDATLVVEDDRRIPADRSRALRLFENLFRNSIEHGDRGRSVGDDDASAGGLSDEDASDGDTGESAAGAVDEATGDSRTVEGDAAATDRESDDEGESEGNDGREDREETGDALTVTVGLTDEGFFVADDGVGLPDEIRERAFDREVTTSREGLGIGLWVVREVARAHGWSVDATDSETGGARFEFGNVG